MSSDSKFTLFEISSTVINVLSSYSSMPQVHIQPDYKISRLFGVAKGLMQDSFAEIAAIFATENNADAELTVSQLVKSVFDQLTSQQRVETSKAYDRAI